MPSAMSSTHSRVIAPIEPRIYRGDMGVFIKVRARCRSWRESRPCAVLHVSALPSDFRSDGFARFWK